MPKAARIHKKGPPEVFVWEEVEIGSPGPKEVLLRQTAVGLNFVDTYHRAGKYHPWPVPPLPAVLGLEGVGIVQAIGPGVTEVKLGDRVGYAAPPLGAYAQARLMPADRLVALPDDIDGIQAAGMMLKGMTAQYLLRRTYRVKPGDVILVHAAAGGMGLILCQWAKHLGATVIGTVSTDSKAELARAHGCDYPVVSPREDFLAVAREITRGEGLPVVYESIGKDTFEKSIECLRPLGMMVSYGASSGAPRFDNLGLLGEKGSLFLTRPRIMDYTAKRADLEATARDLFEVVRHGAVRIQVNQTYPLAEVAAAHRDLESRKTTGSTVLIP